MKSLFMRIKGRKGFTLVECIVAIAVFAAFCLMVMMIVAGAEKESKLAFDTEKELNGLVDNVMNDDINRVKSDTNTLEMTISGDASGAFKITYDVVDGHKNYIACGTCGYFAVNSEFMGKATNLFNPNSDSLTCPMCGASVTYDLLCADCGINGLYSNSALFEYVPGSGSFTCKSCGSAHVSYDDLDAEKFSDAYVSVSGLAANAIRYGTVNRPDYDNGVVTLDGDGDKPSATLNLGYTYPSKPSDPGTYTLSVSSALGTGGTTLKVTVKLPNCYYVETTSSLPSGVTLTQPDLEKNETGSFVFDFDSGSTKQVSFKLTNYKTGFGFDYDYATVNKADGSGTETGYFAHYWLGMSGSDHSGSRQWKIE